MNTYQPINNPVGKTVANWSPDFANWIQLAEPCQLKTQQPCGFASSWQLATENEFANLPTDGNPHEYRLCEEFSVGENSPSYYVGEGTKVPSSVRSGLSAGYPSPSKPEHTSCLLALDLGTTTGWALRSKDGLIAHGFARFKPQRFEGGGMRYLRFKHWLADIKQTTDGIDAVYFEEVRRHLGVDAAHAYGGFMAHLTAWCEHHQIPYQGVPVGTIKKFATGKGNASKDEVIAAMRAKGHPVTDDNEADALALLHWAIETQETPS